MGAGSSRLGIRRNDAFTSLGPSGLSQSSPSIPVSSETPSYRQIPPPRPPPRAPSDGSFSMLADRGMPPTRPPTRLSTNTPTTFTAVHPTNQECDQGWLLGAARRVNTGQSSSASINAPDTPPPPPPRAPVGVESVDYSVQGEFPPPESASTLLPEVDWEVERAAASGAYAAANFFVQVVYDYSARGEFEIDISTGEIFHVFELDPEGDWYHGRGGSPVRMGWFPSLYVASAYN